MNIHMLMFLSNTSLNNSNRGQYLFNYAKNSEEL